MNSIKAPMSKNTPQKIHNTFFDILCLVLSMLLSFPRSTFLFLKGKKDGSIKEKNYFFDMLDFIFHLWPKHFFQKPTGLKLTHFFADFWKFLFGSK